MEHDVNIDHTAERELDSPEDDGGKTGEIDLDAVDAEGTAANTNRPSGRVNASRSMLVSRFTAATRAPGTTACESSLTVPVRSADVARL